jgi:MoxR-like ATPase
MFTKSDCQLFEKYPKAIPFNQAPEGDEAQFRHIWGALKNLSSHVSQLSLWNIKVTSGTSSLSPNGKTPKEIWTCVYPSAVPNKSYAIQLAFILSQRGGELCFCLGAGSSQIKNQKKVAELKDLFLWAKANLATLPATTIAEVERSFKRKWYFRRAWRESNKGNDFPNMSEWIQYALKPETNGGSISYYYSPEELENAGPSIVEAYEEAAATFKPILEWVYRGRNTPKVAKIPDEPKAVSNSHPVQAAYSLESFEDETGFAQDTINDWMRRLRRKKQLIIQGPPGTGKTFVAERLARFLVSESEGFHETLQFHPAYTYEDFIQGLRPEANNGQIFFRMIPGRFRDFCDNASKRSNETPCVLIIDEFNRANLSRVFGELMYLLEYRDKVVPLAANGTPFQIPKNVFLICTMNTADRSIALVDHALRRRFSFVHISPQYEILSKVLKAHGLPEESLVKTLKMVNQAINDQHYEVGTSFFMKAPEKLKDNLREIWTGEVEPYLEEYFYDQPEKFKTFQWDKLSKTELTNWVS